jgi:hypothetical protein
LKMVALPHSYLSALFTIPSPFSISMVSRTACGRVSKGASSANKNDGIATTKRKTIERICKNTDIKKKATKNQAMARDANQ